MEQFPPTKNNNRIPETQENNPHQRQTTSQNKTRATLSNKGSKKTQSETKNRETCQADFPKKKTMKRTINTMKRPSPKNKTIEQPSTRKKEYKQITKVTIEQPAPTEKKQRNGQPSPRKKEQPQKRQSNFPEKNRIEEHLKKHKIQEQYINGVSNLPPTRAHQRTNIIIEHPAPTKAEETKTPKQSNFPPKPSQRKNAIGQPAPTKKEHKQKQHKKYIFSIVYNKERTNKQQKTSYRKTEQEKK